MRAKPDSPQGFCISVKAIDLQIEYNFYEKQALENLMAISPTLTKNFD